jgi:hypothetical protein
MLSVKVVVDDGSISWLRELRTRLSGFAKVIEKPVEILQLIRNLPRGAVCFDRELLATGRANDFRVLLKPRCELLGLMAALRAFNGEGNAIR